jgi:hypothetical protein
LKKKFARFPIMVKLAGGLTTGDVGMPCTVAGKAGAGSTRRWGWAQCRKGSGVLAPAPPRQLIHALPVVEGAFIEDLAANNMRVI